MQYREKILKLCLLMCSLQLLLPPLVRADDEIDISQIKSELSAIRAAENANKTTDSVSVDAFDSAKSKLDDKSEKLKAAEDEVLNKLKAQEDTKSDNNEQSKGARAVYSLSGDQGVDYREGLAVKSPAKSGAKKVNAAQIDEEESSAMKAKVQSQETQLAVVKDQNGDLQRRLRSVQAENENLRRELADARNRIMLAETEVERMNAIIESRHKEAISRYSPQPQGAEVRARSDSSESANVARAQVAQPHAVKTSDDMPIATVTSDKVFLRTGPGKNNSPLMSISKGTRLAVETREGEWYRVITPTGTRAWIASDVVAFAGGDNSGGSKLVQIKGYSKGFADVNKQAQSKTN